MTSLPKINLFIHLFGEYSSSTCWMTSMLYILKTHKTKPLSLRSSYDSGRRTINKQVDKLYTVSDCSKCFEKKIHKEEEVYVLEGMYCCFIHGMQ